MQKPCQFPRVCPLARFRHVRDSLRANGITHVNRMTLAPATFPVVDAWFEHSSHLAASPADLVRWLRLPCAPVLKYPRMFRDAEEWSEDHSGARASLASKRA